MVFRLEEAVAAVAAPDVRGDGDDLRSCAALFDGNRYFIYSTGALVVVLVENQDAATPLNPRSEARRTSQFDLWQVWTSDDVVRCIRFNGSRKAARGAVALCVGEGRGVLLMPCGAGTRSATVVGAGSAFAAATTSGGSDAFGLTASSLSAGTIASRRTDDVASDYAKLHLQLQLTTWRESVRWKSEDRLMDRLEWVESGAEDLLLVGAGERVTIWKIVDDAVQVYLQRSFSLRCGPDSSVCHFGATSGARPFLATAAKYGRIVKVWHLDAFEHDGAPMCQFLAHQRAIQQLQWATDAQMYKLRAASTPAAAARCEMLFTLDKAGNVSIWRETVANRSFVLWKIFSGQDYLLQPDSERFFFDADRDTSATIRAFGLVSHAWARPTASTLASIPDAMLDEANVLSALALFHYGVSSLDDARRGELYSQRMDGLAKINAKLMGDKVGAIADTHAGETFICGNAPLAKTFAVYLLYGVHDTGDLCLFRTEFVPFSGVSPRVSLLLIFNGLREQLADATIVNICSSDYRDRENGSSTFVIEIVFQPRSGETHLRVARLKLQADSAAFGGARGSRASVCYSVQSCEVGDLCDCVFGAKQRDGTAYALAISNVRAASRRSMSDGSANHKGGLPRKIAVSNIDGCLDVFRPSASLRKLQVVCRPHPTDAMRAATHTCCYEEQSVLFFFSADKLYAAATADSAETASGSDSSPCTATTVPPPLFRGGSVRNGSPHGGLAPNATVEAAAHAVVCYEDESNSDDAVELDELVVVRVPETQKLDWCASQSIFGNAVSSRSRPSKDFCVVIGLRHGGAELLVWIFAFERVSSPTPSQQTDGSDMSDDCVDDLDVDLGLNSASSLLPPTQSTIKMTLHRKTRVVVPHTRFMSISSVPSLEPFEVTFASIDAHLQLDLWTFADMDDLTELRNIQHTDVAALIRTTTAAETPNDAMHFHVVTETFLFRQFAISACGRVAVLFERAVDSLQQQSSSSSSLSLSSAAAVADTSVCILPAFESYCEGVVVLEQKKLGAVVSLEWTPPVTPARECELLFLSTTAIGVIKRDASLSTSKWHLAWSSSRFSVKPQRISSLASYPHALLALDESIASVNIHDLSGTAAANAHHSGLPFRIAQSPAQTQISGQSMPLSAAHHPVTLMFLLLRGSFRSLETVLEHVKTSMLEHEKRCYLRMLDHAPLLELPLLPLTKLLGQPEKEMLSDASADDDERSAVYRCGKRVTGSTGISSAVAAPARASDLFAMDYRASRNNADRAELLFAPRSSLGTTDINSTDANDHDAAAIVNAQSSALEGPALAAFLTERHAALTFLSPSEADVFLSVVAGMRKTVAWERDSARKKDEAALRFHASLLWPLLPANERDATAAAGGSSSRTGDAATSSDVAAESDVDADASSSTAARAVGICSEQVVWAAITDFQDELLIECVPTHAMTWREMQQFRMPFWVQRVAKLQQLTEKVAQSEFAATRDPFHVAVFYVLLGKTTLLASLFRMSSESRIADMLSNDFGDARWRNAAIKNAYVLKAKRRYALSTAFFLLGGKVQEAIAVAEHADRTLVLSFLIARLSEKWDLGGSSSSDSGDSDLAQFSFSGLSSNMRSIGSAVGADAAVNCQGVCAEYLRTTVWTRAQACGDVYMSFFVQYVLGETQRGVQCLLTAPAIEMQCIFDTSRASTEASPYTLYWRAFGQSLLGACAIVRFLERTLVPLKLAVRTQIVALETLALNRVQRLGLHTVALVQQRDFAPVFVAFAHDKPRSAEAAAFLACRHRILATSLGAQVDALYEAFLARTRDAMLVKSVAQQQQQQQQSVLETGINSAIRCLVVRGGAFALESVLETASAFDEAALRSSVVRALVHSNRLAGLDFLVSGWNALADSVESDGNNNTRESALPQFANPLPHFIELIVEGIAVVASGDLVASSTDLRHTRRVDQTCSQLLSAAARLLLWLSYYYTKPSSERVGIATSEYVRVAVAAIYSVVCVCARYIRSPCCMYRSLGMIFPHKDALPKKALDELQSIALADVCVHCVAARSAAAPPPSTSVTGTAMGAIAATVSLQQAIPALYLVVEMLQTELDAFVADVKTNRLNLAGGAASSPLFTYCPYWTLVLLLAASGMPAHVAKIAVDGASPLSDATLAAKRLTHVWTAYATRLSKFAARTLLRDLAELYYRPFDAASASGSTGGSGGSAAAGTGGGGGSGASASAGESSATKVGTSSSPPSPTRKDAAAAATSRDPRRLLSCGCARCPWLLLLKLFADKDELLLRLNAQLECCSEKLTNDISWGHLPAFPAKKSVALTRSQKILLSSATAAATATGSSSRGPSTPRAADLVDLFERRQQPPVVLQTSCIYRSEVSIKSMCFNRATETAELVLCSSRGICRTGCTDYSDGSKFQFKGMYANPQASFFADGTGSGTASTSVALLPMRRKTAADSSSAAAAAAAGYVSNNNNSNNSNAHTELSAALGPPLSIGSRMLASGPASASLLASAGGASPSDARVPSFKPTAVESHPYLPLFASGNQKGKVHLWSYDSLSAVCSFQEDDVVATYLSSPSLSSRRDVKKIKFDSLGQQMGAVDTLGRLLMWKFGSLDRETCYRQLECHDKGAKALAFVNAGSCVATVGSSSEKRSVCLWDLLLPTPRALVAAPVCHPAGAASVAFSSTHQLLISGGEGGSISVFDVRQRRVLHTVTNAHETAITTLEVHPSGHCVLSGSASGDVKIWSLPIFREVTALSKVHAKPSFLSDAASNILGDAASNMAINVTSSSWGVTDAIATDEYFFTSGTDGSVQRMRVPSLSKLF